MCKSTTPVVQTIHIDINAMDIYQYNTLPIAIKRSLLSTFRPAGTAANGQHGNNIGVHVDVDVSDRKNGMFYHSKIHIYSNQPITL